MNPISCIYRNGQFYTTDSNLLVMIKPEVQLVLVFNNSSDLVLEEPTEANYKPMNSKAMEAYVDRHSDWCAKIGESGLELYFTINIQMNQIEFKSKLLEDLYLYYNKNWKRKVPKLYSCQCCIEAESNNMIRSTIQASSLNELYKKTYVHFKGNEGSPSANVFGRFYTKSDDGNKYLEYRRLEAVK